MTAILPIRKAAAAGATEWREHLALLGMAALGLLLLFHRDAVAMVRIWLESATFNHCLLILPIIGWLVWQRLAELRRLGPRTFAPALLIVAGGALLWLLGEAGGVALLRHIALVLMLQGAVVACLGKSLARALAFPLFYAFFLIPAGEELVPLLQTVTAHMCMALLGLVGIAAHLEGIFITTPYGYFEVAEACSGVQFLIAMAAYGALVANVCFRSWKRRIAFMLAAVTIPILANGVRAWATIYIASLVGIEAAAGFDHIVYGWVFFAIVIALLMAGAWRFFDRRVNDPWFDPADLQVAGQGQTFEQRSRLVLIGAALLGLAISPLAWSAGIAASSTYMPAALRLPKVAGWQQVPAARTKPWEPGFAKADLVRIGHYRDPEGREVDLAIAYFARQQEGRELVGYGQGAVAPDSPWARTATGPSPPSGRLDRISSFGTIREVASFYRVGGVVTGNPLTVKMETMKVRLLGGPQRAIAVLVSAESPADGVSPRPAIDAFLAAAGPIDQLADRAAGQ